MDRFSVGAERFGALTAGQQVAAVFMFAAGFVCVGYMITAFVYVALSNARLRPGLTREDVEDPDADPRWEVIDEIYLSDAGRLARERAWRCVNRGSVAGAAMFAIYVVAHLVHFDLGPLN